jgi:hypothetical protein
MTTLLSDIKWGNKTQIVDFIKEQSKARRDDLREFHQEMYLNILWVVMGIQDIYYDRYSKKLNDTPPEPWKVRLISNLLYPLLRRSVAKMAKKPIWDVLPATTEQADLDAARISSLILRYYWYFLRMPKKYLQYLTWLFATGNAFFKMGWDAELGDTITLSDEDRAILANTYPGKKIPRSFQLGDPYIEVVSPFSIFWEAGIELEESDWVIQLKLRSPDYVYNRWNVKIEGSTTKGESELFDLKLINPMEHTYPDSEKIITYEFFTNEKHAVVVDDKVVYLGPNVLGSLPYVHTVEQIVPGSEHGMSTLRQARSNQAQYNKVRSGIIEHANLMCAQKWLVPRGANILRQAINNKPGEVILYNYPFSPTATVPPPLPNYYERILETCKQDISDIASVQAVSQAKNEPGIRSGRMIMALQEADDLLMGPVMQLIDDSLVQLGTKFLKVIADNVEEERLIKITGEGNELEVLTFKGKDIYGTCCATCYVVCAGSGVYGLCCITCYVVCAVQDVLWLG